MPSLLEGTVSAALSAAAVAMVTGTLAGAVRIDANALALGDELLRSRQLEHLADRAAALAGAGPGRPAAIESADGQNVVFAADLDGDGLVDPASSETTALEVRTVGATSRVRIRLGRQTMTVLELERSEAAIEVVDAWGRGAGTGEATLAQLVVSPREPGEEERRIPFAVLARVLR